MLIQTERQAFAQGCYCSFDQENFKGYRAVRRHNILFYIAASGLVSLSFSSLVLAASLNDTGHQLCYNGSAMVAMGHVAVDCTAWHKWLDAAAGNVLKA